MEGLLPLVFKAIRKNRTRRHYECLSSSGMAAGGAYINMAEIHPQIHNQQRFELDHERSSSSSIGHHHRRHKSVEDFGNGRTGVVVVGSSASSPKQLFRFGSQRRMFSCISGA